MNTATSLLTQFYLNQVEKLSDDEEIIAPLAHLLKTSGKKFRYRFVNTFNHWLNIAEDKMQEFAALGEVLHSASLLIDDIQDNSALRRGVPVAHHVYSIPSTVNSAYYIVLLGFKGVILNHGPDAASLFAKQLLEMHVGQGMEIYWRNNLECPTEEEYFTMVNQKTGAAFRVLAGLMQIYSTNKCDFEPFIYKLAVYFQVSDDYKNLTSDLFHKAKGFAEDLTEGKFGFPLIHCIKNFPEEGKEVLSILRQRTEDLELKKRVIFLLKQCGSLDHTLKVIDNLRVALQKDIKELGENPDMEELVSAVIDGIVL